MEAATNDTEVEHAHLAEPMRDIHLNRLEDLRRYLNVDLIQKRGPAIFQMNDFFYEQVKLQLKMSTNFKKDIIQLTTIMPTEDDRDIPEEELINIQPREIIEQANYFRQETKFREILNWDNKGLIVKCTDVNPER
jgi:hypothetical protein